MLSRLLPAFFLLAALPLGAQQTLQLTARRVILDVTVIDSAGHPVPNLAATDFRIAEDSTPQALRSFELHTSTPQPPVVPPDLPPNTYSNFASGPAGGTTTVILYDLLNTPLDSQAYAHAQLIEFLRQRGANGAAGQVAVFVLGGTRLRLLQGFTDDDNQLIAALNHQGPSRSTALQSPGEAAAPGNSLARTEGNQNAADARGSGTSDVTFQNIAGMLANMETVQQSYLLDQRIDLTAGALQQIARFLAAIPGRKSLLWLSGSFPSGIIPNADADGRDPLTGRNEFNVTRNYGAAIKEATDLLNTSHVAVYPIDVRGLQTNPMFSAASNQTFEPGQGKDGKAVRDFATAQAGEHTTMDTIANQTGGRAFYNTNGLKQAAAQAMQESSLYYTLTYSPTNPAMDGKLRRVRVELTPLHSRSGYTLAYRRSYFAASPASSSATSAAAQPADPTLPSLQHGAPAARDLFFEAHVAPAGPPAPATPDQMKELLRNEAFFSTSKRVLARESAQPPLLQPYIAQFVLIPRQLNLTLDSQGNRHNALEFDAVAFNAEGQLLSGTRLALQDVIHPDRWDLMQQGGYHIPLNLLVPTTATSLRLAIRDTTNNHLGTLELPLPQKAE